MTILIGDRIRLCSGTLVHERVFLTAGHCVATILAEIEQGNITLDNVYVSFNSDWFLDYWHHTLLPISDVFLHPDYTGHPTRMAMPTTSGQSF